MALSVWMKTEWLFSEYSNSVVLTNVNPPDPRAVKLYLPGPNSPIYEKQEAESNCEL